MGFFRFLKFLKRETPLLRLRKALHHAGFNTFLESRSNVVRVWKEVPGRTEFPTCHIDLQLGATCFCFVPELRKKYPEVDEAVRIAEGLRRKGVSTSPVAFTKLFVPVKLLTTEDDRARKQAPAG